MNNIINKSDFMLYIDAPRHLWAKKHDKYKKKKMIFLNIYLIKDI